MRLLSLLLLGLALCVASATALDDPPLDHTSDLADRPPTAEEIRQLKEFCTNLIDRHLPYLSHKRDNVPESVLMAKAGELGSALSRHLADKKLLHYRELQCDAARDVLRHSAAIAFHDHFKAVVSGKGDDKVSNGVGMRELHAHVAALDADLRRLGMVNDAVHDELRIALEGMKKLQHWFATIEAEYDRVFSAEHEAVEPCHKPFQRYMDTLHGIESSAAPDWHTLQDGVTHLTQQCRDTPELGLGEAGDL